MGSASTAATPGALSGAELRELRSNAVSMVYQNPGAALNPSIRVGKQVAEVFSTRGASGDEATDQAREALTRVQIADPGSVMGRYAHQLSGGMQQRVVIAMALATDPALLILDEPTTGLDATVEAEVLDLVAGLQAELRTSVLFISHNLGIIRKMCDRVGVLYAGSLVEEGATDTILADPRHPYTVGLLRCVPRGGVRKDQGRLDTIPGFMPNVGEQLPGCVFAGRCTLAVERCRTEVPDAHDLGGVAHEPLPLPRAGADAAAGDGRRPRAPGCRPCGRAAAAVRRPRARCSSNRATTSMRSSACRRRSGRARRSVSSASRAAARRRWRGRCSGSWRRRLVRSCSTAVSSRRRSRDARLEDMRALQIVFQNPDSALNRRHTVRKIMRRSLKKLAGLTGSAAETRTLELMSSVRLAERYVSAQPGQLSGGLKQRLAIARSFAGNPKLVVCDEPTSALDVSVQAAILNLLVELQAQEQVSYLFISHDLGVVRYVSDRIAVLYLGRLMELGLCRDRLRRPSPSVHRGAALGRADGRRRRA